MGRNGSSKAVPARKVLMIGRRRSACLPVMRCREREYYNLAINSEKSAHLDSSLLLLPSAPLSDIWGVLPVPACACLPCIVDSGVNFPSGAFSLIGPLLSRLLSHSQATRCARPQSQPQVSEAVYFFLSLLTASCPMFSFFTLAA